MNRLPDDNADAGTIRQRPQWHRKSQMPSISKWERTPPNTATLKNNRNEQTIPIRTHSIRLAVSHFASNLIEYLSIYLQIISSMRKVNKIANTNKQLCTTNLLQIKWERKTISIEWRPSLHKSSRQHTVETRLNLKLNGWKLSQFLGKIGSPRIEIH